MEGRTEGQLRGDRAEEVACRHLLKRGLRLLTRNYRTRRGEIDLIMEEDSVLVFVEVRYRQAQHYGGAIGSVGVKKQQRLQAAAQHYLQANGWTQRDCRFDLVAITAAQPPLWLRNIIVSYN